MNDLAIGTLIAAFVLLALVSVLYIQNRRLLSEVRTRKRAEAELQQSEAKYRSIFENAVEGIYQTAPDGRLLSANPAFSRIIGYSSPQEMMDNTTTIAQYYTNLSDRERLLRYLNEVGAAEDYVVQLKHKDGSLFWASLRSRAVKDEAGKVLYYEGTLEDISARKQAEEDVRTSRKMLIEKEERLRNITANMPGVVYQFYATDSGEYGLIYASERMTEFFGLPTADLDALFPAFLSCVHEEDRDRFLSSIRSATERCALWNFEGRFVKPSGQVIWFHGLSTPTRREDRVVFDGVLLDITDRKQAEEALEKRIIALTKPLDDVSGIAFEDLFNIDDIQRLQDEFADATGVASIITHTDGTPITRPSRFCHFCIDIVRKTEKGLVNCYRSDAVLGRLSTKGPAIQPCMSGGLWDAGAGISVGGRHIANWLIGQVRDATQTEEKIRVYAREIGTDEEALVEAFREVPSMSHERFQQVSQALFTLANQLSAFAYQNVQQARFITERKQAEEKFYKVFMTTPDCVVITRLQDGRFIEVNQGFEDIVGWKRDEAIEKTSLELGFWANPRDRDLMVRDLESGRDILHREFQFGRKDGTVRTGIYSARLVHIADEACLVFVLQDITDQRHLEEERWKLEQQLFQSQKMDAIGQLAGGIAHDFNNILLAVSGNAKLAAMDLPTDHPLQDAMAEIIKGCDRGTDLVRRILLFSRPQKQEHKIIRLQDVVKEALKLVRSTIPAMIRIETEFDPRAPAIIADAGQIHQIVVNLATNAAQAIGQKSGCIKCTIEETHIHDDSSRLPEGRYVQLSMADDGCGMEREIVERIFDPFFTTKATGQGTGLGLSVVHGIMKSIGGGIVVQSEPGKGSVFSLYFPASDRDAGIEPTKGLSQNTPAGQGKRVLYVDDDGSLVMLIKRMLERGGYRVTGFTDPVQALNEFFAHPDAYDVVVTDLSMPGMSGFSFAVELLAASPDTPVFMTSGYVRQEDEEKARQIGIRSLILKPDTLEGLQRHLAQLFAEATGENR